MYYYKFYEDFAQLLMGHDFFIEQIFIAMMNLNDKKTNLHVYNSICFFFHNKTMAKKVVVKKMDEWKYNKKLKFNKQLSKKMVISIK